MRSKRVLLIGLKPTTLDYGSFPNLNAERVMQELKSEQDRGSELGYDIDLCLINSDGTDIDIVSQISSQKQFDCILIGAGLRVSPQYFLLFERVMNIIHRNASSSVICFNTNPSDSISAIKRWI